MICGISGHRSSFGAAINMLIITERNIELASHAAFHETLTCREAQRLRRRRSASEVLAMPKMADSQSLLRVDAEPDRVNPDSGLP